MQCSEPLSFGKAGSIRRAHSRRSTICLRRETNKYDHPMSQRGQIRRLPAHTELAAIVPTLTPLPRVRSPRSSSLCSRAVQHPRAKRPGTAPGRKRKPALNQRSSVLRVRDAPFPRPSPFLSHSTSVSINQNEGQGIAECRQTQVSKDHGVRVIEPVTLWGGWTTSSSPESRTGGLKGPPT